MSYLESRAERDALSALPLESALRKAPFDRLVARLKIERGQADGGLFEGDDEKSDLLAVVLAERTPDKALKASIESLALQSNPSVRCILVPTSDNADVDEAALQTFVSSLKLRPRVLDVWPHLDGDFRQKLQKGRYVTFLRHGDRLHPSAAAWLAIERGSGADPDVVAWGELQPDGAGGVAWLQRNPALHLASLLHFPYLRNAFAVRARFAASYPGDLARETRRNHLHLFQIWLTRREGVRWASHPEYFRICADDLAKETPKTAARRAFADYADAYEKIFSTLSGELQFIRAPHDHDAPYRLTPRAEPGAVSVIIPFRDKPDLTAAAVKSIAAQSYSGFFEILLINNESSAASLAALKVQLSRLPRAARWRIIDYPHPFNHSAQCNLGARHALGEVLVFMNNDAEFVSRDGLQQLAAWAHSAGIATVGAAIQHSSTGAIAAGMDARLAAKPYFDSITEERSDEAFTPFVREVFGNSFALTAISRTAFDELGGLDELRFPNGYNDVDFCCRAREAGRRHIALGHVIARHAPGQSRASADEIVQKLLIRTLHAAEASAALTDLRFDDVLAGAKLKTENASPPARAPAAPPMQQPAQSPLVKRVAFRLANSQLGQRILANPTAYRLIRRTYKLVVR